jgi:hypothetical protein
MTLHSTLQLTLQLPLGSPETSAEHTVIDVSHVQEPSPQLDVDLLHYGTRCKVS